MSEFLTFFSKEINNCNEGWFAPELPSIFLEVRINFLIFT